MFTPPRPPSLPADTAPADTMIAGTAVQPDATPARLSDTGLSAGLLVELMLKQLLAGGELSLEQLSERLALLPQVIEEIAALLLESDLLQAQTNDVGQLMLGLNAGGRVRAAAALDRDGYIGPTPIALGAYQRLVSANAIARERITRTEMAAAFAGVAIAPDTLEGLGRGLNSSRALLVHGPSGAGKTFLCQHLAHALPGCTLIPYAIACDDITVPVYDPVLHDVADADIPVAEAAPDPRLVRCRRPALISGVELSRDMLDLGFDPATHIAQAPLSLKANNGIYVVDDLGRQQIPVDALIRRWTLPMETRQDWLHLHSGRPVTAPFDVILVLVTHHDPDRIGTDAFHRRIGHRVHMGAISREQYLLLWQQASSGLGLDFDPALAAAALDRLHAGARVPPLPSHPGELLSHMRDQARYADHRGALTSEMLHRAWAARFPLHPDTDAAETACAAGTRTSSH